MSAGAPGADVSDPRQADEAFETRLRWRRLSKGLYLAGIGVFLLLTTQGRLPTSFWADAARTWPVLLIAIGVRILFERSPFPWLILAGPCLVLGTMTHLALQGSTPAEEAADWGPLRAARPPDLTSWTLEGKLALARLDVESRPLPRALLLDGRSTETGRHAVRILDESAAGRVRLTNASSHRLLQIMPGPRRDRSELVMTTALPVTLDLDLALTTTRFDVPATPVSRVDFDGAFNTLTLRLGEPSSDVRLDLEGAFNRIVLEVPAVTPVRVTSKGFLNYVDRRSAPDHDTMRGPAYRLRLDGAFNTIVIRNP